MNKHLFAFTFITIMGCMTFPNKNKIIHPSISNSAFTFKTDGYYYNEKTIISYCKHLPKVPGMGPYLVDPNSKYEEKIIQTIILYNSGCAYHSSGSIFTGIDRNIDGDDYCYQLPTRNSWKLAQCDFEKFITVDLEKRRNSHIFEKGVYNIKNENIQIQIYESGSETLQLMDYQGKFINDSTILIKNKLHHNQKKNYEQNDVYKFVRFKIDQDAKCYILENIDKFGK